MRTLVKILLLMVISASALAGEADVIDELSARSHIAKVDLNELLNDCINTQLSMNICAFRDFIAADLEMQRVVKERLAALPASCNLKLTQAQRAWEENRDKECQSQADAEAQGGTMRPMINSVCSELATKRRITVIRGIASCKQIEAVGFNKPPKSKRNE